MAMAETTGKAKKAKAKAPAKAPAKAGAAAGAAKKAVAKNTEVKKAVAKKTKVTENKAAAYIPTHQEIAALAVQYWMERGRQHGQHIQDWLRAEQELMKMAS
jgi:hypothetical protein